MAAADDNLSEFEKDALISNMMKEKAKITCDSAVKAFTKCAHQRTFSLAWACRKEHKAMKDCMEKFYRKADFQLWKEEYLRNDKHDQSTDHDVWNK
ncbi:unnamed protein product [Porites lobata]|uniref:COX assembly mitochondrial protein n=1 Tax=Porites lobata TaxID=104759 RepID=A0ABN8QWS8_9CNID|nr:unnamed protein product [Porites lobata]